MNLPTIDCWLSIIHIRFLFIAYLWTKKKERNNWSTYLTLHTVFLFLETKRINFQAFLSNRLMDRDQQVGNHWYIGSLFHGRIQENILPALCYFYRYMNRWRNTFEQILFHVWLKVNHIFFFTYVHQYFPVIDDINKFTD